MRSDDLPGGGFALPGLQNSVIQKRKKPIRQDGLFTCLMPGSSLLSHGETPHYHRRYGVSLLSSAWGQVGPPRYSRQTNSCCSVRNILSHQLRWLHSLTSVTYLCMLLPSLHLPPCRCANYCALQSGINAENSLNPPKHLRRCKVKPHGSLVPVSSTHRCAYTPGLSTSSSSTFLQDP